MRLAVQMAPTLLHFSVYLFFAGLVVLFRTIDKNVAIAVDISVGIFVVAYIILSILPCLDVSCPYRTPMSSMLWYPLHTVLSFVALLLRWFVELLHGFLVKPSLDNAMTSRQRILVGWLESCEKAIKTHMRYITDGLGESIINCAINTQGDGDRKIVTRLFGLLASGNKSKLRKFAASIPRDRVFELIPLIESGRIILQEYLLVLLRSCANGTRVAESEEDVRKRSLLVCLDSIHYIAKDPSVPDLNFVRANFANIGLMKGLWNDSDASIRFTSRSICALVAKQVVRGELEEPQLLWLHNLTKEQPGTIFDANIVMRDRMNLKSFVYGVFSNHVDDLPTESFKETLAILLGLGNDAHFETDNSQNRLSEEVRWIQRQDGSRGIVDRLRLMFPFLPANSGDASPPPNIMPVPISLYPSAQPSTFTASFRSLSEHTILPDSTFSLSDSRAPFPELRLTHSHGSNVPLEDNMQSPPPPPPLPPPPPPPPVPSHDSHDDRPFVDSHSHLATFPPDATVPSGPSPVPHLTDSHVSNVPPGL